MHYLRRWLRRPLRTVLALLQILLGTLAMTLALSAYLGSPRFNSKVADSFEITAGWRDRTGVYPNLLFLEEDITKLKPLMPDVKTLALFGRTSVFWPFYLQADGLLYEFADYAIVSSGYFEIANIHLTRGSFFTEVDRGSNVVVMSDGSAKTLFGDKNPIGQQLGVPSSFETLENGIASRVPFTVIGTFADKDIRPARILYGFTYYTIPPLLFPAWSAGVGPIADRQETYLVKAQLGKEKIAREQLLAAVRQFYKSIPDRQPNEEEGKDFYLTETGLGLSSGEDFLDLTTVLFGIFGVISLIVSTIGIFSTMLVEMLERTHDLGVCRAIGASQLRIVQDFSAEAALLACLGGLLGIGLAALIIPLMQDLVGDILFSQTNLYWRPLAALISMGVVVALSSLLSLIPVWQASKMKPIEALRSV
jgi:ABC-type antimicrobial peptide transport system permease subunit